MYSYKCCHCYAPNPFLCIYIAPITEPKQKTNLISSWTNYFDLQHVYCLFAQVEHTSQETVKTAVETLQSVRKEETAEMAQELQKAVQDHATTTSEELSGTVSKTVKSFLSQSKKVHTVCTSTVCTLSFVKFWVNVCCMNFYCAHCVNYSIVYRYMLYCMDLNFLGTKLQGFHGF